MKKLIKILLSVSMLFTCFGVNVFAEGQLHNALFEEDTTLTGWQEYLDVSISDNKKVELKQEQESEEPFGLVVHGSLKIGTDASLTGDDGAHLVFDNVENIEGQISLYDQEGENLLENLNGFVEFEYNDGKWKKFVAPLEEGLYFSFDPFEIPPNCDVSKDDLFIYVGQDYGFSFYYYDGDSFTDVDEKDLIVSDDLDHSIESWENDKQKKAQVLSIHPNATGEFSIKYNEKEIKVIVSMPEIAFYLDNEVTTDNLVTNLFKCDTTEFYLLPCLGDDWEISSWSIYAFKDGNENKLIKDEDYSYDDSIRKLTFYEKPDYEISIKYEVSNASTQERYYNQINIRNYDENGGGDGDKKPHIDYKGEDVVFGLAGYSEDANLHMTDGYSYNSIEEDTQYKLYLSAGIIRAATALAADEDLFAGITEVSAVLENSTFDPGTLIVSVGDAKETNCEREMWPILFDVLANSSGDSDVKISFDLTIDGQTQHLDTYAHISITFQNTYVYEIGNMDDFNTVFSSYANFKNVALGLPEDVNNIVIVLPQGEHSGNYQINIGDYNSVSDGWDLKKLVIEGHKTPTEYGENFDTTINGTLKITGGFADVRCINFVANDSILNSNSNLKISNATFGVFAESANGVACGSFDIYDCSFSGYDYAVCSTYSGIICDINNNDFENCTNAYYMDCNNNHLNIGGDNSSYNTFNNCKYAVSIISTPEQLPAYSLRFKNNYFYHDDNGEYADFYIRQNDGVFYFQENYYGTSPDLRFNPSTGFNIEKEGDAKGLYKDLRTVKIDKGTANSPVVTNPCIRYAVTQNEETNDVLGIDPTDGLEFRIFSGIGMQIDSRDVANIKDMGIGCSDGQEELGSFDFTKEAE